MNTETRPGVGSGLEPEAPVPELTLEEMAHERARDGAAFLDRKILFWADKLEKPIDISNRGECVLGQLYDEYRSGLAALGLDDSWALTLGFRACTRETRYNKATMQAYYKELNRAWKEERKIRIS